MTIDAKTIESLADWLLADAPAGVDETRRSLLVAALRELAITSALAARQALLLASYDQDVAELERTLRRAVDQADSTGGKASPADGYDFAAAEAARKELVRRVESAASIREIIDAGLGVAAHAAGLI